MRALMVLALLATGIAAASAADFPSVPQGQPTVAAGPYNWSGIYVGANAGYGWTTTTTDVAFNGAPTGTQRTGSLGGGSAGGQIGANYQFGMGVVGLEVDGQWSGQNGNKISDCGLAFPCSFTDAGGIDSFATARVRLGAAFDRVLLYGTAGAAWTSYNETLTATVAGLTLNVLNTTGSKIGLVAGVGLEVGITRSISAKVEYLYLATDGLVANGTFPALLGGGAVTETIGFRDSIMRFGLNARFGAGP